MNITSPSKTLRNCMANENSKIENMEKNAEIEFKKNMNLLLFHNSIQNFLRLDNSTEEIKIDFNVFLIPTSQKDEQINLNSQKIFFSDVYYLEMEFEKIYLKSYSSIFENYIKIFKSLNHCNNCQKLFKINGSCKCISDDASLAIINFTENFICILNFMNYKEKIFNELMLEMKKKKVQTYLNNNNPNKSEFGSNYESPSVANLFPIIDSNYNFGVGNLLERISNKKNENYLYSNLIAKYNSELSVILKFFLKCLLNNYKCEDNEIKQTCIKPEIKELILRCKLAKTIETFIGLIVKDEIKFEIDIISGFYDKPYLEELYNIIDNHFILWIKNNLCCNPKDINTKTKTIKDDIIQYLHREYIKIRVDNFFEIIKAYPDSSPILSDVRKSIGSIQQNELIEKIKSQIEKRLLNQGIATSLIIEIFIRLINIMKYIDTSSILLEIISSPIKQYLRSRKDTMRCIINLILNEEDLSLKAEIETQGNISRKKVSYNNINLTSYNIIENLSSDEDELEAEKWEPLALEITKNQKIITKNKFSDIISTLVFIFGSPEEFVEHYKRMLAERSVSDEMSKFSIETEIKNLELLKVKFGENYFQSCEVLIKDVKDSIKMNKSLKQQTTLITKNKDLVYNKNECKLNLDLFYLPNSILS